MANGRIAVHVPGHPAANNRGYVLRSRYIVEQSLGRYLTSGELIHHRNGNKTDDRLVNLELTSRGQHTKDHWSEDPDVFKIRKLDYALIAQLESEGLGHKRISKATGYHLSSVKHAVRVVRKNKNKGGRVSASTGSGS